jgi:aspartate kinase
MIVLKFGGNSLSAPDKVRRCAEIVKTSLQKKPVVVVSAHGKTTDTLIACARKALEGEVDTEEFSSYHYHLADSLAVERMAIEPLVFRAEAMLNGVRLVRELTPRTLDAIMSFGERIAARIFTSVLCQIGVDAVPVNSYDIGFVTDSNFGNAAPVSGIEERIAESLLAIKQVPVITGFLGKDAKGNITTIGRSGSDYTAAVIGAAIGAQEVQIWKDVDGVLTANPSVDARARNLPELSFTEASELAYYGAEVLHPSTLIPAIRKNIPVRVANTTKPNEPGTLILTSSTLTGQVAKSVVCKRDVALLNIVSQRLLSIPTLLSIVLDELARQNIKAHMVVTSEASISIITDRDYAEDEIAPAIARISQHASVCYERSMAIICVVGEEMKGKPEVLGKIFSCVGEEGVKARIVSQSASELNIAFLVRNSEIEKTVKALHSLILG